ncbi:MAG: hypothetical protein ACLFWG_06585 [Longimicrobiales bacterium]
MLNGSVEFLLTAWFRHATDVHAAVIVDFGAGSTCWLPSVVRRVRRTRRGGRRHRCVTMRP